MINFIWYVRIGIPLCLELQNIRQKLKQLLGCRKAVYTLFKAIDTDNKGQITGYDIAMNLLDKNQQVTGEEAIRCINNTTFAGYLDFYNFLFGNLKDDLPQCCSKQEKHIKEAKQLVRELLIRESCYNEKVYSALTGIRDMTFQNIYSTFNKIDTKGIQMINSETLSHFMTDATEQLFTEMDVEPFLTKEFKSQVVSFPQFFEFFEGNKKRCKEIKRKKTEKLENDIQKQTQKKVVKFANDLIKTANKRQAERKEERNSERMRVKKKKPKRPKSTLKTESNRFLRYYREGQVAKEARVSCQRLLRLSTQPDDR